MDIRDGWGFDYSLESVVEMQNKKPNAACTVDGKFYDIQNCVAEITRLRTELAAAEASEAKLREGMSRLEAGRIKFAVKEALAHMGHEVPTDIVHHALSMSFIAALCEKGGE